MAPTNGDTAALLGDEPGLVAVLDGAELCVFVDGVATAPAGDTLAVLPEQPATIKLTNKTSGKPWGAPNRLAVDRTL